MQEASDISIHMIHEERLGNGEEILASLRAQSLQSFQTILLSPTVNEHAREAAMDGKTLWLRTYRHHGFARMHNQAITLALSRWADKDLTQRFIVLCHMDMVWDAEALSRLHAAFLQDPTLMIAGPTILRARRIPRDDEGGSDVEKTMEVESQGLEIHRNRCWTLRRQRALFEPDGSMGTEPVFGVPEPCLMMRASAVQALLVDGELLDPDVHRGQEIWDVMWRARWMDSGAAVVSSALVWHYAHESSRNESRWQRILHWYAPTSRQLRQRDAERGVLEIKNDDPWNRLLHAPWIIIERARHFFSLCLDPRGIVWMDPERWLRAHRKRRVLIKRRRISAAAMRLWFRP